MNFFEVTIVGELVGQQVINRLTFITDPGLGEAVGSSLDLLQVLGFVNPSTSPTTSSVLDFVRQANTNNYSIVELAARNIYNVVDFYVTPVVAASYVGHIAAGTDTLPTFVASRIQTNRVRTDVRRGSLALTGGTEEMVEGLNAWNATYQGYLQDLCDGLNAINGISGSGSVAPYRCAVLSKEPYTIVHGGGRPDTTAYKYWETAFVQQGHTAVGVSWSPVVTVTSQVTRKIGRGS